MKELWEKYRVCGILRGIPQEWLLNYVQTAMDGGIRLFEVAMNSQDGELQIRTLKKELGNSICVGAGTVTTLERCKAAADAGAEFFLTPCVNRAVLEFCVENKIPILPGVMTPTDVSVCMEYGCSVMKLFPAGSLPKDYIKSLKGPFDGTEYVAVGGVKLENAAGFIEKGFLGVGIGSGLISKEQMEKGNWGEAKDGIASMMAQVKCCL